MKYKIVLVLFIIIGSSYSVNSYNYNKNIDNQYNKTKERLLMEIETQKKEVIQNNKLIDINIQKNITSNIKKNKPVKSLKTKPVKSLKTKHDLSVDFYPQSPFGEWTKIMKDACEEASVLIAINYIKGIEMSRLEFKDELLNIVKWEKEEFGYYKDTNTNETNKIIKKYYNYNKSYIIDNPTIYDIKKNISEGSIIILPLYGKGLNPNFVGEGPEYHFIVIKGYEDDLFITHEVGSKYGKDYKYNQKDIMNRIHDYNGGSILKGKKNLIVIKK